MSAEAWAYVAGGAGREATMAANLQAFQSVYISPHVLGGAGVRDLRVSLFGVAMAAPVLMAPIGVLEMAHPEADLAVARAAARLGLPIIISTQASFPMEQIAKANDSGPNGSGARLYQLYWGKEDKVAESFVRRAEACGCAGIVITLDTTMLGWRTRDLDLGYVPFLHGLGIAQYTSDPVFRSLLEKPPEEDMLAASFAFTRYFNEPGLNWARIAKIREWTKLPVILKGILRADDAAKAVAEGYDGIIVTNHGGRQVDGAIGALAALPGVVAAVGGKIPVLFDSGIYGGADAFKALALGAKAVGIGRPYIYGLALAGEAGVEAVLRNILAELDLTMALSGVSRPDEIGRHHLA
jgi:lactate 2-monooxygenase